MGVQGKSDANEHFFIGERAIVGDDNVVSMRFQIHWNLCTSTSPSIETVDAVSQT